MEPSNKDLAKFVGNGGTMREEYADQMEALATHLDADDTEREQWTAEEWGAYIHNRDYSHRDPATKLGLSSECVQCRRIARQFLETFGPDTMLEACRLWIESQNAAPTAEEEAGERNNKLMDRGDWTPLFADRKAS